MDIAAVVVVGAQAVSQRLVGQARRRRTSYSPARGIISSLGASLVGANDEAGSSGGSVRGVPSGSSMGNNSSLNHSVLVLTT